MTERALKAAQVALILFFVAWVSASSWYLLQLSQEQTQNQGTNHPSNEAKSENNKFLWKPNDAVSLYTLVLALFSGALVIISGIQIRYLTLANQTARIAAKAAKKAADVAESALLNVEVAYPYAMIRHHWINVENQRIRGVNIGTVVSFYFKNHGRTPASITEVFCQLYVEMGIPPPIIPPEHPYNWFTGEVVPPGEESRDYEFVMNDAMFKGFYEGKFAAESNIVWLIGYARYSDVFENDYILGFCFAFGTAKAEFYAVGGDDYNYRKKVKSAGDKRSHDRVIPA